MAPMLPMGAPILGQFSESPKSPKQDATKALSYNNTLDDEITKV